MRALVVLATVALARSTVLAQPTPDQPPPPTEDPVAPEESAQTPPAEEPIVPDEPAEAPRQPAADPDHSAASVANEPRPGKARGFAVGPEQSGEWALWIPRVVLFPFRVVAEAVGYPVRKTLYAYEVYDLGTRVKSIFFNEEGTAGLFPVAFAETGFGLNVGARLILRELAGSDAQLSGRASFGGRFRQLYSLKLDTKETWKRFNFDAGVFGEFRPRDQFWGIGNGDELEEQPGMPVDPLAVDFLRQTRFKQRALRAVFGGEYRPHRFVRARASGAVVDREFDAPELDDIEDDELITDTFDVGALTGFDEGSRHIYAELEVGLDTRSAPSFWEGPSTPSSGFLIAAFAGRAFAIDDGSSSYNRYGADAQRYFRLGPGPRVLTLRVYVEGVTGGYDEIPFYDLPQLGGPLLLRGYDLARFRDRVAMLGAAEYQWDLSNQWASGFIFTDVGRTFPTLDDFTFTGARLGFGGGLEVHSKTSFLGRFSVASSTDGGLFFNLSFDPVYDIKARAERR